MVILIRLTSTKAQKRFNCAFLKSISIVLRELNEARTISSCPGRDARGVATKLSMKTDDVLDPDFFVQLLKLKGNAKSSR